jgi:hypothetical protein
VLTKLLFLRGGWLEAGLEEYGRCSEVLGGPFGDGSPLNVIDDAAAYRLCAFMCRCCHCLCAEHVVEPHLLILESLLSLIQLIEARLLSLTAVLGLRRFLTSGCVERSGLTFRGAVVRVGGVDRIGLLLEDETLAPRVMGRRRLLARERAFGLVTACLRSPLGDRPCVSHGGGSFRPAAGEPRLLLRVHGVIAELEPEHEHGGREHREAEELLGRVRP